MHGKALNLAGFVDGIDISAYQNLTDAHALRAAGFEFAGVKISEGLSGLDRKRVEHLRELDEAGVHVMPYCFARVEQGQAREQAKRFIDACGYTHRVRPVLDIESCPKGFPSRPIVDFCLEWMGYAEEQGAMPVLYTFPGFWAGVQLHYDSQALTKYPLWMAQYRSTSYAWAPTQADAMKPRTIAPWKTWDMWQYSGDKGYAAPGVQGDCDRNLFRVEAASLREFFGLPEPIDPDDNSTEVEAMRAAREAVRVQESLTDTAVRDAELLAKLGG